MVAMETRNGARRRVPAMGTSHTYISLFSIMYLTVERVGRWPDTGT